MRTELANAFSLDVSKVRVLQPDMGSGYGGKHTGEVAIEAARLAKAAGKPAKPVWSREEEFAWAYFRPAGVMDVRSGISQDGKLTAWEFHNWNSGTAGLDTPYDVPNKKLQFHPGKSPFRQGSYRGLAATANNFARESHMDELARAAKLDPLEFHLRNTSNERLRAVIEAGAKAFGWQGRKKENNRGFGMAASIEKGGYVATFVELTCTKPVADQTKIERIVTAFECGAVINPDNVRNQIEGCLVMGLGGALFEAIHFENGQVLNPAFSQYPVPRFSDIPKIEMIVLDRKDLPSAGAGECPIVGIAPAIANAIFDATNTRLRGLPLLPRDMV